MSHMAEQTSAFLYGIVHTQVLQLLGLIEQFNVCLPQ